MLYQNNDNFYFRTKILVAGLWEDSSFFFLLSISGIPKIVNKKKYKKKKKMADVNSIHGKKFIKKKGEIKDTTIKIKCVGRGTNLHYLLCLISNTLPQSEQSSLHLQQFSAVASCYRPPATTISVFSYTSTAPEKENRSSNRLETPLSRGLRSQKGLFGWQK